MADVLSSLPHEILAEIIARISCIKSILRCTLVCKSLNTLIKSPFFINLHLSSGNNIRPNYLLCQYIHKYAYIDSNYILHHDTEAFDEYHKLVFPENPITCTIRIYGCCDGLICYSKYEVDDRLYIYLWNPSIKKVKVVPCSPDCNDYYHRDDSAFAVGFWFDKSANDYMVAIISYSEESSMVEIYSLRSNSWKIISKTTPGIYRRSTYEIVYLNGKLHWTAIRSITDTCKIISLDIQSGVFQETIIGLELSDKKLFRFPLSTLGGKSLVVLGSEYINCSYPRESGWSCYVIQVYDQNLNKICKFDLGKSRSSRRVFIGYRNNHEVLFRSMNNVSSCNLDSKTFKEFVPELKYDSSLCSTGHRLCVVHPFTETLVLLNDGLDVL